MFKFPYGISDFREINTRGYYYRDRTHIIPEFERTKSCLFIRPRQFGKSLVLSMLENYYDIARRDAFETFSANWPSAPIPQRFETPISFCTGIFPV